MEENTSLFSLSIDPVTKTHLSETARWARFLAIVGFVFLLLIIAFGLITSLTVSRYQYSFRNYDRSFMQGVGVGMAVFYIIVAVIAFFPFLFMFRFASQMRSALYANDQNLLNSSFQNLKIYFCYVGIITVISLVLVALSVFMQIASRAI